MSTESGSFWIVTGESVTGASHIRRGQPNQDAIEFAETKYARIVSIADGHGSSRYFRSERGARFAARTAVKVLKDAMDAGPHELAQRLQEQVPRELVRQWKHAVAADLRENCFTPGELALASEKRGREDDDIVLAPLLAYGSTVLAVLATDEFLFFLQLGDGDILAVSENGAVSRPLPRDPRLVANETTSLCMVSAVKHIKVQLHHADPQLPALVMLSTDGYSNSYATEDEFLRLGEDYFRLILDDGFDSVSHSLAGWLTEVTSGASGDDITVALLFRPSALAPQRPLGVQKVEPLPVRDEESRYLPVDLGEASQCDDAPQPTTVVQYQSSGTPSHSSAPESSTVEKGVTELDTAEADVVLGPDSAGMHLQPPGINEFEQENPTAGLAPAANDSSSAADDRNPKTFDEPTSVGATPPFASGAGANHQRKLFVGLYERPPRWKPRLPWKQSKEE